MAVFPTASRWKTTGKGIQDDHGKRDLPGKHWFLIILNVKSIQTFQEMSIRLTNSDLLGVLWFRRITYILSQIMGQQASGTFFPSSPPSAPSPEEPMAPTPSSKVKLLLGPVNKIRRKSFTLSTNVADDAIKDQCSVFKKAIKTK